MNLSFLDTPQFLRLGWVLVHFVWEGALIGLFLFGALRLSSRASAATRHLILCAALAACALAPPVTWTVLKSASPAGQMEERTAPAPVPTTGRSVFALATPSVAAPAPLSLWERISETWAERGVPLVHRSLPVIVALWSGGVAFLLLRLALGWRQVRRLLRSALPVEDRTWESRLARLRERMGIGLPIRLLQSAWIEVPTLVGWLRPTLLVPIAFFTDLPVAHVEAIFAHELAHVARHDFVVNLLQIAVETLLFYHPVVWWIGRELREVREECCDELAARAVGDRRDYALALAALEEFRAASFPFALSARGGSLLRRLRHLALPPQGSGKGGWRSVGIIVVLTLLTLLAFGVPRWIAASRNDLVGIVLDQDGRPLPGAEVRIVEMGSKPKAVVVKHDDMADFAKIARSNGRGKFVLPDLDPSRTFILVAAAPGYGPDYAEQVVPEGGRVKFVLFKLKDATKGGSARGHVVGPDGMPVSGAVIQADEYHWRSTSGNGVVGSYEWQVSTDRNGDFTLPGTWGNEGPNQGVSGQIRASGFAPVKFLRLPYNDRPRTFVLDRGVTVTGQLLMEGIAPLGNVEVVAETANRVGMQVLDGIVVPTDPRGRFVFANLPANTTYRLYAERASVRRFGVPRMKTLTLGASGTMLDMGNLDVMPGRKVTGQIILSDGKPLLSKPQLHINTPGGSFLFNLETDGRFEFAARDGEAFQLYAWIPGYRFPVNQFHVVAAPEMKPVEMLYEPEPRQVKARIILSDGKALSRPIMVVVTRTGAPGLGENVDGEGRFSFSAAVGDRFSFEAAIPGYRPAASHPLADGKDLLTIAPDTEVHLTFDPVP